MKQTHKPPPIIQMSPWEKHLFLEDLKVFVAVSKRIEARLAKKKSRKRNG